MHTILIGFKVYCECMIKFMHSLNITYYSQIHVRVFASF